MQENEFEKKVEDRLSDLKLPPSDAVWASLEAELHKKKRRRVIFYIFLLAGLGLAGYSGYTLLDRSTKSSLVHENNLPVNNEKNNLPANDKKVNSTDDDNIEQNRITTDELIKENDVKDNIVTPIREAQQPVLKSNEKITDTKKTGVISKEQKAVGVKGNTIAPINNDKRKITKVKEEGNNKNREEKAIDDVSMPDQQKDLQQVNPIQSAIEKTGDQSKTSESIIKDEVKKEDTVTVADTMKAHAALDTAAADVVKEELAQPKKIAAKKIKWGLDLSGGATFSRNKTFSVANSGRVSADRSYYNNSPLTSGAPQNPGGVEPPSSVSAGPAFKVGAFAELGISKRSSISAGLRYAYLSERMKVGNYKDTFFVSNSYFSNASNNGFYGTTRQKEHTNSYHFIELPVSYQLRLNKPGKLQLLWNTGITAAYLVNTSSLVYDTTAGGIYYKQPNVINRLHFNLHTGFSFRFVTKKNFAWSVGPELSLDMTRLMKQDIFTRERYLFYGGLSAKIFLPSLKK